MLMRPQAAISVSTCRVPTQDRLSGDREISGSDSCSKAAPITGGSRAEGEGEMKSSFSQVFTLEVGGRPTLTFEASSSFYRARSTSLYSLRVSQAVHFTLNSA
jgi:hypothetical protein